MTLLKDMSETHRQAWATFIVDAAVFAWFFKTMTRISSQHFSVERLDPQQLGTVFIATIVITIILHAVIAGIFAARSKSDETPVKDEWDIRVERKGEAFGYGFLTVALNFIIGALLLQNALGAKHLPVDMMEASHLFFVLMSAAFIADLIKNASMILSYRGE